MRKRDRPIPFPQWSQAWKQYIRDALKFKWAKDYHEARAQIIKSIGNRIHGRSKIHG